ETASAPAAGVRESPDTPVGWRWSQCLPDHFQSGSNMVHTPVSTTPPFQRVLIVDGDEDTRDLYQTLLVPRRYSVEHATNGREALAQAILHPPDIIVME